MAVVDWVRVGEGRPEGGGASAVRTALSARDKRFRWLAKLSSSSTSSAISSGMIRVDALKEEFSEIMDWRSGEGSRERGVLKD
jgi:hypothetical protein